MFLRLKTNKRKNSKSNNNNNREALDELFREYEERMRRVVRLSLPVNHIASADGLAVMEPSASISSSRVRDDSEKTVTENERGSDEGKKEHLPSSSSFSLRPTSPSAPLLLLPNLTDIDLSMNSLSTVGPLLTLASLTSLNVSYNRLSTLLPPQMLYIAEGAEESERRGQGQESSSIALTYHLAGRQAREGGEGGKGSDDANDVSKRLTLGRGLAVSLALDRWPAASSLARLDVSNNLLSSLNPLPFLPSLKSLDVSGNSLKTLEGLVFREEVEPARSGRSNQQRGQPKEQKKQKKQREERRGSNSLKSASAVFREEGFVYFGEDLNARTSEVEVNDGFAERLQRDGSFTATSDSQRINQLQDDQQKSLKVLALPDEALVAGKTEKNK